MLLKKGSKGNNVKVIQEHLKLRTDGDFGPNTEKAVKEWQKRNGLIPDGIIGPNSLKKMGLALKEEVQNFDITWKDKMIEGSHFPSKPIKDTLNIRLSKEMKTEYIPALDKVMIDQPKGFKLLCTIMAHKEGFFKGSRSYRTNNPGNIGNTDSGSNKKNRSLEDGILLQRDYILKIADGKSKTYPMGAKKTIKPYYSPEIAKHSKSYGMSPYLPGYDFIFTGQLDQFVKIYSTGARGGNGYLSMIVSYFKNNGIDITSESKIQNIIKIK